MIGKRKKQEPTEGYTVLIKKQAERIEQLRIENDELRKKIEEYRQKEQEIADTLVFAKKRQEEYLTELRVRYALENERLRRFCEKMNSYRSREELLKAYDDSFASLQEARQELENIIENDLGQGANDYLSERKRLGDTSEIPFTTAENIVRSDLDKVTSLTEEELRELLEQL